MHKYHTEFFENGQQVFKLYLYEAIFPEDDPVCILKEVLEKLNYDKLLKQYSHLGRKGFNPLMIYAIILYANMHGIRSVPVIVEKCKRDIYFKWLARGEEPSKDVFYDFMNDRCTVEILEELHYQFIYYLYEREYLTLKTLFIDGTKIEANANRYTFVWRGSINYHLIGLLDNLDDFYSRYNSLINEKGYKEKYHLVEQEMFVIEGIEVVRKTIAENRERKQNKKKKKPNNKIIKIDNMCPLTLLKLCEKIKFICDQEGIVFETEKRVKKPKEQKLYIELMAYGEKLIKYKKYYEILGDDRNSFSKTDLESTFMRMKEDHMLNGQLKPAYNVQFAVENFFIVHTSVSNDRTDYNTLIPIVQQHNNVFKSFTEEAIKVQEIVADSGYSSENNLQYLHDHDIAAFIKAQNHEQKKKRKYHEDISKHYNMEQVVEIDTHGIQSIHYVCHDNRILRQTNTETYKKSDSVKTYNVYSCDNCSGCNHKAGCINKYDENENPNKNKVMKVNENFQSLRMISEALIQSDQGIKYRKIRSVMTEGSFGDMKANDFFRRFNHRGTEKNYKELLFYIMGRNLMKLFKYETGKLVNYTGDSKAAVA